MRPTGVALLDDVLGGLTPGFPLVLVGPTGSGRTVLCLQLAEAACRRGEAVAVLTGEPAPLLLRQAGSMGLDLVSAIREGRLALLELDSRVASTVRVHGGAALVDDVATALPEIRLLLIDPLTPLASEVIDEVALRAIVRAIFDRASTLDQSVVVTIEQEQLADNAILARVLKDACGAIVELEPTQDGRYLLGVRKSRVAGFESGPVHFRIGAGGAMRVVEAPSDVLVGPEDEAAGAGVTSARAMRSVAEPAVLGSPSVLAPEPAGRRPRVLVADADAHDREQIADWLSETCEVVTAEDGFAAMSAMLAHQPDLIVLELVLPRVDGYEVMRALRGAGGRVPMLVVSSSLLRAADRVRALVLGASDTLPKPAQRFELRRKVAALLRAPAPPPCELDPEVVEALLGGSSSTRMLDECAFREQLERACRFGDEFGLGSVLVALEVPDAHALEALTVACEKALRSEDALCAVADRRLLLLLVGTESEIVSRILDRLRRLLGKRGGPALKGYRWFAECAQPVEDGKPWDRLFEKMTAWPAARKNASR